jgi:MFS family permease
MVQTTHKRFEEEPVDSVIWIISTIAAALLVAAFVLTFVPFFARYTAYRHSVDLRVDLPVRLEPGVSARFVAQGRGATIGGLVFLVAAVLAIQAGTYVGDGPASALWVIVGAVLVGSLVGGTVAAFTSSTAIASDQPRVARSRAVSVADYLAPLERVGAWVLVVASVVVAVTMSVVGVGGAVFPVALFAGLGAVTLVMFEVASARIVDRSQPAGSTADLVWDDAMRSSVLRDLISGSLALGGLGLILGIVQLVGSSAGLATAETTNISGPALSAVGLALSLYSRAGWSQRYFLGRLWPNLRWSDTADAVTDAA